MYTAGYSLATLTLTVWLYNREPHPGSSLGAQVAKDLLAIVAHYETYVALAFVALFLTLAEVRKWPAWSQFGLVVGSLLLIVALHARHGLSTWLISTYALGSIFVLTLYLLVSRHESLSQT